MSSTAVSSQPGFPWAFCQAQRKATPAAASTSSAQPGQYQAMTLLRLCPRTDTHSCPRRGSPFTVSRSRFPASRAKRPASISCPTQKAGNWFTSPASRVTRRVMSLPERRRVSSGKFRVRVSPCTAWARSTRWLHRLCSPWSTSTWAAPATWLPTAATSRVMPSTYSHSTVRPCWITSPSAGMPAIKPWARASLS